MIINGQDLLRASPIIDMFTNKVRHNGVSHGLTECGYDIRIKQDITFLKNLWGEWVSETPKPGCIQGTKFSTEGRFTLASSVEEFQMPFHLAGVVHDKSTWARQGLSVFNTVIEPGWKGFLTLELVYNGQEKLHIPAGSGIAQVLFSQTSEIASYSGKYNNQPDRPIEAIFEKG
jgi:dCTP deaminase